MKSQLQNGYQIEINEDDQTALILKSLNSYKFLHIPKYIFIDGKKYEIICLGPNSFKSSLNPKILTFAKGSKINLISKNTFNHSSLKNLYLPPKIEKIEEGWCKSANYLYFIKVSSANCNIKYLDDNYLICQNFSNNPEERNRTLIFARRDIETAVIPFNIKKIGDSAFEGCSKLKSVNFDKSNSNYPKNFSFFLEEIGDDSFSNCKVLETIDGIPSSVKRIGKKCFSNCLNLKSLRFEEKSNLRSIGHEAFYHTSLYEINFPSMLECLEEGWCNGLNTLNRIIISEENKLFEYINDQYLIKKCQNETSDEFDLLFARRDIESAIIPSKTRKIGSYAFSEIGKLESVTFQSDILEEIGCYSFYLCSKLENVNSFPASVKRIKKSSFEGCKKLKSIQFPKNSELQSIEKNAFKDSEISEIFISDKVEFLEEGWCNGMNSLVNIVISPINKYFVYFENRFLVNDNRILFARRDIESIVIPSHIKRIANYSFYSCKQLKSIQFHYESSLLEEIGEYAFSNCSSLENALIFPSSLKQIYQFAFTLCNKIESISFGSDNLASNLAEIGDNAFYSCYCLKFLSFPATIRRIGKNAFRCSGSLKKATISSSTQRKMVEIDDGAFNYCRQFETISGIPSTIKRIGHNAFENCVSLKEIIFQLIPSDNFISPQTLPSGFLEEIGNCAFAYCRNLEVITLIPSSIQRIGRMAFAYCSKLQKFKLENDSQLKCISVDAFFHSGIIELAIPSKFNFFEEGWCRSTTSLTKIILSSENKTFKYVNDQFLVKRYCPYEYESIIDENDQYNSNNYQYNSDDEEEENNDDSYCLLFARRDIKSVVIPFNIKRISYCAFEYCSQLKSIDFGNLSSTVIEYIGDSAFAYCFSLESITLDSRRIKRIGKFAFFQCKKLRSIFFAHNDYSDNNGSLVEICENAFDFCENLEFVSTIPKSVKLIGKECFRPSKKIMTMEFLGDEIFIGDLCFDNCQNLFLVSIPNANSIVLSSNAFYRVSLDFTLFVSPYTEIEICNNKNK